MWGYGGHWLWSLGWLFVLLLVFGCGRFFWWRSARGCWGPWCGPYGYRSGDFGQAEAILRERLARGEIDQAEYDRIREVLKR